MTLLEYFDDWCNKEVEGVDRWVNKDNFCRTKSDIRQAENNSLQRMFGIAMFIQTLDNAPTFEQIDARYDFWRKKIENLCELRLLRLTTL